MNWFEDVDGALRYVEVEVRRRVLFSDGSTVDVLSPSDGSEMRQALLKHLGKERIEGVAEVALQEGML